MGSFYDDLRGQYTAYQKIQQANTDKDGEISFLRSEPYSAAAYAQQERDDALAIAQHQEEYNSEHEKIKRMRAAGLNPDLVGLESASTASEPNMPSGTPPDNGDMTVFGAVRDSANLFLSSVHEALGVAENIAGLRGQYISNDLLSLESRESFDDYVARYMGSQRAVARVLGYSDEDNVSAMYMPPINDSGMTRGAKRSIRNSVGRFENDPKALMAYYDSIRGLSEGRLDAFGAEAKGKTYGITDEAIARTMKVITDEVFQMDSRGRERKFAEDTYEADYYKYKDAALDVSGENAESRMKISAEENSKFSRSVMKKLNEEAGKGNMFAQIVLFFSVLQQNFGNFLK